MKLEIKIDKKPFSVTEFFSGTVTDNQGEHEFTIVVNYDNDQNWREIGDITWLSTEPKNKQEAEDLIRLSYEK